MLGEALLQSLASGLLDSCHFFDLQPEVVLEHLLPRLEIVTSRHGVGLRDGVLHFIEPALVPDVVQDERPQKLRPRHGIGFQVFFIFIKVEEVLATFPVEICAVYLLGEDILEQT